MAVGLSLFELGSADSGWIGAFERFNIKSLRWIFQHIPGVMAKPALDSEHRAPIFAVHGMWIRHKSVTHLIWIRYPTCQRTSLLSTCEMIPILRK